MKRAILPVLLLGGALWGVTTAQARIEGSQHDFSTETWIGTAGQCGVCHRVHHAQGQGLAPLWDHATSQATFQPYTSPTLTAAVGQPTGPSLACLSCHDGTVAINTYGTSPNPRGGTPFYASKLIGPDLRDDHPVSFVYDTALAVRDGGLHDPATKLVTTSATTYTLPVATVRDYLLYNNEMHCTSCHDVHKMKGGSVTSSRLTIVSGQHGGCLNCHNK